MRISDEIKQLEDDRIIAVKAYQAAADLMIKYRREMEEIDLKISILNKEVTNE